MSALDQFSWGQFRFGNSAGTDTAKIVFVVNALRTAQLLISILSPLRDQISIGPLFIKAVLVEFLADFLS